MKKVLAILSFILVVSACGRKEDTERLFEVNGLKDSYEFAADLGQVFTFDVVSDNVLWEIELESDWLSISPLRSLGGYETVTITPFDNASPESRSCRFTLKAENGFTTAVNVTQKGLTK